MIVGFSKHGRGKASGAIRYLTDRERNGVAREPAPTILRGDPALVASLIDGLPFSQRYTSGVLSFARGESVTREIEDSVMDRFEAAAFAGLEADQYAILWVRHEHAGHHELNFLVPRVELSTGKSMNIAPPGARARALFDTFRSLVNVEYGFADPEDPARVRFAHIPPHVAKLRASELRAGRESGRDPREIIGEAISDAVSRGDIDDRAGVMSFLRTAGFDITREGKDYVSVRDPESNSKYRLKGPCFHANFQRDQLERATEERFRDLERPTAERITEYRDHLADLSAARAQYNQGRYSDRGRSPLWAGLDRDVQSIAKELALETGHEREGLEANGIRNDGARISDAVLASGEHSLSAKHSRQELRGSAIEGNDNVRESTRRICDPGGRLGDVHWRPDFDNGQPALPLRYGSEAFPLHSREEALGDDGARAPIIERIRTFANGFRRTGEQIAHRVAEWFAEFERAMARALDCAGQALERYDHALGGNDETLLDLAHACERFERPARTVGELARDLGHSLDRQLGAERSEALEIGFER